MRENDEAMAQHALNILPENGEEVLYREWHEAIRTSEYPEAIRMIRSLQKQAKISQRLEALEDGSIRHTVRRA